VRVILVALVAGLLFGLGLTVSGMIDPARVLAFLDLAGAWNPSLAFVLAAAVAVTTVGYRLARRRAAPFCASTYQLPTRTRIDLRLATGAVIFGLGWGLVGYCPGPALAGLALGVVQTWFFVAAMLIGMAACRWLIPRQR
jgi:uncharacterized membrane protein YedE/YeeE